MLWLSSNERAIGLLWRFPEGVPKIIDGIPNLTIFASSRNTSSVVIRHSYMRNVEKNVSNPIVSLFVSTKFDERPTKTTEIDALVWATIRSYAAEGHLKWDGKNSGLGTVHQWYPLSKGKASGVRSGRNSQQLTAHFCENILFCHCFKMHPWLCQLIMAALCNRGAIIFLPCSFYLLSIFFFLVFPRLISAAADWMSTILLHMAWP